MQDFILKSIIVTICTAILLFFFMPRYHFFDSNNRVNLVTGQTAQLDFNRWVEK